MPLDFAALIILSKMLHDGVSKRIGYNEIRLY